MPKTFDIAVIGGGPGGYVSAIRSAQLGFNVALIEKHTALGGTCLNVGCIPSKALLDSSEYYHLAKYSFADHGVEIPEIKLNFGKMLARKENVISSTAAGIDYLIKKNKITRFAGLGSFIDNSTIKITQKNNSESISFKHAIIATGSEPTPLPLAPFDGKKIISSTHALSLKTVPEELIIIGGGVIGLEIGSVYGRLGANITVIESFDSIIPVMDRQLAAVLQKSLKKLNFKFHLNTNVTAIKAGSKDVAVTAEEKSGNSITIKGSHALVSIGRRPFTSGLNLDAIGLKADKIGRINVNNRLQTSVKNIYAVGDVIRGPMLAHKAEEDGVAAAEFIAGEKPELNHDVIPSVVYTWPEVASVGKSEEELKAGKINYKTGNFPFKASGRARALGEIDGFVKVLSDQKTDEILGIHMIGPRCSDMIAEAVVAMEFKASAEDIGRIVHAHPTFTESLKEAALMATAGRALHM